MAAALNRPVTRCQVYRAGIPKWQQAECSVHEGQTYAVAEIIAGHQSAAAGYGALVQTVWVPRAPVATVNAAVSVCIDALTYPVARAFALLGRGASSVELHQLRQPLRSALTLT